MAIETYKALEEQMREDAMVFAATMRASGDRGQSVVEEFNHFDEPDHFTPRQGIWIVRIATRYDGTSLAGCCAYQSAQPDTKNYNAECQRLGTPFDMTYFDREPHRQPEPGAIAITALDGNLGIVTDHSHGADSTRRRVKAGWIDGSHFLGKAMFYDNPAVPEAVYEQWRASLEAFTNPLLALTTA